MRGRRRSDAEKGKHRGYGKKKQKQKEEEGCRAGFTAREGKEK